MNSSILPQGTAYTFKYLSNLARLLELTPNSPNFRRLARAHQLVNKVELEEDGIYMVGSQTSSESYRVSTKYQPQLSVVSCTCPDFRQRWNREGQHTQPCKHQYAVLLYDVQPQ